MSKPEIAHDFFCIDSRKHEGLQTCGLGRHVAELTRATNKLTAVDEYSVGMHLAGAAKTDWRSFDTKEAADEFYDAVKAAMSERAKAPDYFCVGGRCGLGRHVSFLDKPEEDTDYCPAIHRVRMAYAGTSGGSEGFTTAEEADEFYAAVKDAMEHAP